MGKFLPYVEDDGYVGDPSCRLDITVTGNSVQAVVTSYLEDKKRKIDRGLSYIQWDAANPNTREKFTTSESSKSPFIFTHTYKSKSNCVIVVKLIEDFGSKFITRINHKNVFFTPIEIDKGTHNSRVRLMKLDKNINKYIYHLIENFNYVDYSVSSGIGQTITINLLKTDFEKYNICPGDFMIYNIYDKNYFFTINSISSGEDNTVKITFIDYINNYLSNKTVYNMTGFSETEEDVRCKNIRIDAYDIYKIHTETYLRCALFYDKDESNKIYINGECKDRGNMIGKTILEKYCYDSNKYYSDLLKDENIVLLSSIIDDGLCLIDLQYGNDITNVVFREDTNDVIITSISMKESIASVNYKYNYVEQDKEKEGIKTITINQPVIKQNPYYWNGKTVDAELKGCDIVMKGEDAHKKASESALEYVANMKRADIYSIECILSQTSKYKYGRDFIINDVVKLKVPFEDELIMIQVQQYRKTISEDGTIEEMIIFGAPLNTVVKNIEDLRSLQRETRTKQQINDKLLDKLCAVNGIKKSEL